MGKQEKLIEGLYSALGSLGRSEEDVAQAAQTKIVLAIVALEYNPVESYLPDPELRVRVFANGKEGHGYCNRPINGNKRTWTATDHPVTHWQYITTPTIEEEG